MSCRRSGTSMKMPAGGREAGRGAQGLCTSCTRGNAASSTAARCSLRQPFLESARQPGHAMRGCLPNRAMQNM